MYTFSQLITIVLLFVLITFLATAFVFHAVGARSQFKQDSTVISELESDLSAEQEDNARLSLYFERVDNWTTVEDQDYFIELKERATNGEISWARAYYLWQVNRPTVTVSQLFDQDKE